MGMPSSQHCILFCLYLDVRHLTLKTKVADDHRAGYWWHLLASPEGLLHPGRQQTNFCLLKQNLIQQLNLLLCKSQQSAFNFFDVLEVIQLMIWFPGPTAFPKLLHSPTCTIWGGLVSCQMSSGPVVSWVKVLMLPEQRGRRMKTEKQLREAEAVMRTLFRSTTVYNDR